MAGTLPCALWFGLVSMLALQAQTVRPAVVELAAGKHGATEGRFELVNDSLEPVAVTMEAKSFTIDRDSRAVFRTLDTDIHLELSETSLRLPARQSRTVYYRVTTPRAPAWFCVYSNFTPIKRRPGMQVQLELPHTVYLLGPGRPAPASLQITTLQRRGSELTVVVRNTGGSVQRVTSVQLVGGHAKQELAGFPLLPQGERELTVPNAGDAETIRVNTVNSHVSESLGRGAP